MTSPNVLGPIIVGGELHLPYDADWIAEIEAPEDSDGFPADAVISWTFPEVPDPDDPDEPTVWTAELTEERIDGRFSVARWEMPKAEVKRVALTEPEPETARLHHADVFDQLWDVWRVRRV